MATIKMSVYDGTKYEVIELEEVLNEDGAPTGYYKQIGNTTSTIFGVLDDKEEYDKVCRTIDEMTEANPRQYFFSLSGSNGYMKVFTTFSLNVITNSVSSISKGVLDEIAAVGYVTKVEIGDGMVQFLVTEKGTNSQIRFIFKSFLEKMIRLT